MALSDADLSDAHPVAPASGSTLRSGWSRRRIIALLVWNALFACYWVPFGFPTDSVIAIGYLWAFTVAWNWGQPWRHHLRFARDWGPVVVLLLIYDASRGHADNLSAPHILAMIKVDTFIFGQLPTVWLQAHFYDPSRPRWWDSVASVIYISHFVVSLTIMVALWLRNRPLWVSFTRRWFVLTAAGLATYFLYPAAPPWYASKYGFIHEHVERFSSRGLAPIGLDTAGKVVELGQDLSNQVAAMPSLHSGFAAFCVAFFLPRVRKRWWPVLLSYPLLMAVILAYTGEHYIIDAFAGWAYVGLTFLAVGLAERWWRLRRERQVPAEAEAVLVASVPAPRGSVDGPA